MGDIEDPPVEVNEADPPPEGDAAAAGDEAAAGAAPAEGDAAAEGEAAAAGEAAPAGEAGAPAEGAAPEPAGEPAAPAKTPEEQKRQREYDMYLAMAKSLTLQLPFERDRVIASKWVKKIEASENEQVERLNYLKLLCVSMFSHKLAGPFKLIPNDTPELDEIGDLSTNDIITDMVQETNIFKTTPYYVEMSGDLKEYAAYQEIPNFGAHFYYAFSNETILNWHNEKRAIVPTGGLNYPILDPPPKHISKSPFAFKDAYRQYANPEANGPIPHDMLPNLITELHNRKVVTKEEISKMGTKKLISEVCKCAPASKDGQNKPGPAAGPKPPGGPSPGRPAGCGAKPNVNGRPAVCAALRQAKS